MSILRVAVLGAGAAGLAAARHLADKESRFSCAVFEQTNEVGGTWVYTERTGLDDNGLPIHSSMYQHLRTNLPKEIMGFPDFPFHDGGKSFIHHTEVLNYLKSYASNYDLYQYIQFETVVKSIRPKIMKSGKVEWIVKVKDLKTDVEETHEFDAVMVCNGHYSDPFSPQIPGIETFSGEVIHSHDYRCPLKYSGLNVIVLGAASSGLDISLEVAKVADKVYLSHRLSENIKSELPSNVVEVHGVTSAHETGFILADGSSVVVDVLIYCTGYNYNFSFLSEDCRLKIEDRRITPLYQHLVHIEFPTLCFVGIPTTVLPFPLFHLQVKYFLKSLEKSFKLPSQREMKDAEAKDFHKKLEMNMPKRYAHRLASLQWDYFDSLCKEAEIEPLTDVTRKIYNDVCISRAGNLMHYKDYDYRCLDNFTFVRVPYT